MAQSMKEDFAWLDSLDLADTRELRFVKTETKEKVRSEYVRRGDLIDTEHYPDYHYGFLLEDLEDGKKYRLLSIDLSQFTLEKGGLKPLADSSFGEYGRMPPRASTPPRRSNRTEGGRFSNRERRGSSMI